MQLRARSTLVLLCYSAGRDAITEFDDSLMRDRSIEDSSDVADEAMLCGKEVLRRKSNSSFEQGMQVKKLVFGSL